MKAPTVLTLALLGFGLTSCGESESVEPAKSEVSKRTQKPLENRSKSRSANPRSRAPQTALEPRSKEAKPVPRPSNVAAPVPNPASSNEPSPEREEQEAKRAEERAERMARFMEQVGSRIMQRDTNKDGLLSKDEIPGPMSRRFEDVDANGDGFLDADEQKAMLDGLSERMSQFSGGRGRGGRDRGGFNGGGRGSDRGGRGRN